MATDVRTMPSLLPVLDDGGPTPQGMLARRLVAGAILALVVVTPMILPESPYASWISLGLIYVTVGISLNILIGYAGQVSLGHQAFVGVGAFTSALVVSKVGLSFWFAVVLAAATGAIAAVLLGFVALRLKGLFLALITLAYGQIAEHVIFAIPGLTGGGAGSEAPRPAGFDSPRAYTYLVLAFVAALYYLDHRLMKSKAGRAILAIKENEIAAASFGINTVMYKLLAFVLSGALAGVAGSLYAHYRLQVVNADFSFGLALTFVLMVVVGGLGSRVGIFIGSMTFAILPLAFNTLTHWVTVIGSLLLLMTLTMYPGGVGEQLRPITDWLRGKSFSMKKHSDGIQSGGAGVRP